MNTNPTVTSALRSVTRVAALGACLTLAACGDSQNWKDGPEYVTVGGGVSGLTGTVVLQNNGQDDLSITANGPFTFGLSIANGKPYAVTVSRQPYGQVCVVTNGSGTASDNVTSIAVACKSDVTIGGAISGLTGTVVLQNNFGNDLATTANGPFTFTAAIQVGASYWVAVRTNPTGQNCTVEKGEGTASANVTNVTVTCGPPKIRDLPASYTNTRTKAINYSPYRGCGPGCEVPSDDEVLQDLGLLHDAGFKLLRLFGADDVSDKILRLAARYSDMEFQQGIYLAGLTSCTDHVNDEQIRKGVYLANKYSNVVTVSVGNETSFFSKYMPPECLERYVTMVRSKVKQPVTADDDYSYYAGLTTAGADTADVRPDAILPLLDFVSIHIYPFSNTQAGKWDWQQAAVTELDTTLHPNRAEAMMNASLKWAQEKYDLVAGYPYMDASGSMTSIGASLPIVIGETGWKAALNAHPQPGNPIEVFSQPPTTTPRPVSQQNAKWYYDLSIQVASWTAGSHPPKKVFYFEAFDETWKQLFNDDGWGLWDIARTPRYVLCDNEVVLGAPVCDNPVYLNAGYWH